jgi:hypothetical protein
MKPKNNLNSPKENGEEITTTEIKKDARKNECNDISKWNDPEFIRKYQKEYRIKHKLKARKYHQEYYHLHRENLKQYIHAYHGENKERIHKQKRGYYQRNKIRIHKKNIKNRDVRRAYNKIYYSKNKRKLNQYRTKYLGQRYKTDVLFKVKSLLRGRLYDVCKRKNLIKPRTMKLLGCDLKFFKLYIESQFKPGMTWNNHGKWGWHIDHIIPLDVAKTSDDMEQLCHYKNLQPLWWYDNLSKSGTIPQNNK